MTSTAPMFKRLVPVSNRATEVWGIDEVGKAIVHIVVIAGNPGAAGYYAAFIRALHARFEQRARVWAVSSLGFHTLRNRHDTELPTFTLHEQCVHKADFLRDQCLRAHDLPVVVLGHSIGAYMAIKALGMLEESGHKHDGSLDGPSCQSSASRIVKVVGLFPFFQTTPSNPKQRVLRLLCKYPGVLAGAAHVLEHCPAVVRRFLVSVFGANLDAAALTTTDALLRWDAVRNAFTLAATEFVDLDDASIWDEVGRLSGRLCVLGAPNDHWFPLAHYHLCEKLLPCKDVAWDTEQMHAFCVSLRHSKAAARAVEVWIRQALVDAQAIHPAHSVTALSLD